MKSNQQTSLKSISEKLNLSVTTVSRALNGLGEKYRISKKTIEKIKNEAEKHNFRPNQIARGLRLNKTETIGLVIPDISNPFFATIARVIENEFRKNGYSILLTDSQENSDIETESIELLLSRKVDGLVICSEGTNEQNLKEMLPKSFPVVLVDRFYKNLPYPFVGSDNKKGAFDGVSHLIEMGHKKIAFIQGIPNSYTNKERLKGYKQALKHANIDVDKDLIIGNAYSEENGYQSTKILLTERIIKPTAIFTCSNQICFGALNALEELKIKVPNKISLVTFDEQPYSSMLKVPLTTIAQDKRLIAETAVELLSKMIIDKNSLAKTKTYLPTKLIARKSVKQIKE